MSDALVVAEAAEPQAVVGAVVDNVRTLVVKGPDAQALLDAVSADMEMVPLTDVDSDEMAEEMRAMLGRLSTVASAIEKERKERKAPLLAVGQWLDNGYNPVRDNVTSVIDAGKKKLLEWSQEVQRRAREERERQEAEARARAEEAARIEAQRLAEANAAAQKAQELREKGSEQAALALETEAMAAADKARDDAAQAAVAAHVAPVRMPVAATKGTSETWKAECIDKAKLLIHIGNLLSKGDRSLGNLVQIDQKAINALAKLQKADLNIPGLRPYAEGRVAVRKQAVA